MRSNSKMYPAEFAAIGKIFTTFDFFFLKKKLAIHQTD